MPIDFDVSREKRSQIDKLLIQYTSFGRGNTDQNREDNARARTNIVNNLFANLTNFGTLNLASTTFGLNFDQDDIEGYSSDPSDLFKGIAAAISLANGGVVNFHGKKVESDYVLRNFRRYGRFIFYWEYLHYKIKVVTRLTPPRPGFIELYPLYMTITDKNQPIDDGIESGNDTEDDHDPYKTPPHMQTLFILQSLHDRVSRLEASYGLPTASPRRLE
jgi:hypothetical protein